MSFPYHNTILIFSKGLTADKLMNIEGYPTAQNVTVDGVTWFKEDSYKNTAYHKLY